MRAPVQAVRQQEHDVRIVVAHQSSLLAEALGRLLDDLGLVVVALGLRPQALLTRLADAAADALVLDAGFDPLGGSLGTLDRIRAVAPELHVVVIADALDEALSVAARDGDLDGVVLASAGGAELVAAVAQVGRRPRGVPRRLAAPGPGSRPTRARWGSSARASARSCSCSSLGMDNDQIATRLYISRNTVKFHVRTIYGRLGVHNRVEAARVLAGAGVVSAA